MRHERPPGAGGPFELLRDGHFIRVWVVGALLGTVRWLEILGVGIWTFAETRSPLVVALMLFARTVPMPLLGVPMGTLADRVDRRRLLRLAVSMSLATSTALTLLAWSGWLALWQVAIGAFVSGVVWTTEHPVRRALIADVVGIERVGTAISLDSATFNATRMSGPLLGGAIYAALGLTGTYAFSVVAQALSVLLLTGLRTAPRAPRGDDTPEPFGRALAGGIGYVRTRPVLAGVMVVTIVVNFFGFSYSAMVPVIGERTLALDAFLIGLLMSMEGLGALMGALTLAFVVKPGMYGRIFVGGGSLFLAMLLAFSQSASLTTAMLALWLGGIGIAGFGSMQSAIAISGTTPELRSRVMGVLVVCIGAGPLGVLLIGALASVLDATAALVITSSAGVLGLVIAALVWPALWRGPRGGGPSPP